MAMTYLELCQRLAKKAGVSGGSGGLLTTVVGQTGEAGRICDWIDEAYLQIQMIHPQWDWMRKTVSFTTTAGKASYTPAECGVTDLGEWKKESFRTYITSVGTPSEVFLGFLDYDRYRDTYLYGNMRNTTGRPISISIAPSTLSLNLGLTPDTVGYTVVGEYFHEPLHLTANTDTPSFPSKYHMLVVYRAMMFYGAYEAAAETYQEGLSLYNDMVRRLNNEQLQDVTLGSSLA